MDNRAGEMQVFLRVVEAGSFSAAARLLLMTPSTVSKLINRIETRLGVRLLERSTRRLSLTSAGQTYYERSRALLEELEQVEHDLAEGNARTGGTVKINASVGFGLHAVEPLLPAFFEASPDINVDLSLSDEIVDLYLERTDVAFRVGKLQSSSLTAVKLGTASRKVLASPAYLEQFGTPETVDDLADHKCMGFNFRHARPVWPLRESGRVVDRHVAGPLVANNGETLKRMALAGVGLARIAEFHVRKELAEGRLVEVLAHKVVGDREDVHALFLGGSLQPRRVRAFLDFMVPHLRRYLSAGEA